jgi:signal transduction histidine kinase
VKAIAEAHNGKAEVSSTLGHGSIFLLRLPRA